MSYILFICLPLILQIIDKQIQMKKNKRKTERDKRVFGISAMTAFDLGIPYILNENGSIQIDISQFFCYDFQVSVVG